MSAALQSIRALVDRWKAEARALHIRGSGVGRSLHECADALSPLLDALEQEKASWQADTLAVTHTSFEALKLLKSAEQRAEQAERALAEVREQADAVVTFWRDGLETYEPSEADVRAGYCSLLRTTDYNRLETLIDALASLPPPATPETEVRP